MSWTQSKAAMFPEHEINNVPQVLRPCQGEDPVTDINQIYGKPHRQEEQDDHLVPQPKILNKRDDNQPLHFLISWQAGRHPALAFPNALEPCILSTIDIPNSPFNTAEDLNSWRNSKCPRVIVNASPTFQA
ncbi:hypothetical protein PIB30_069606 [Stylosanthes scabra]|uniref:Uncharacterized protein n=1 Tax=Stylosanthes scabra TaxID=79078 RepID=A0ABU6QMT1_9FABA|nr:hypothetical protein [Stylosanthes scabra]